MKKVKCIDNCGGGLNLTIDKIYDVLGEDGNNYNIECDTGGLCSYKKYRFTDADIYTLELSHEELVTMRALSGSVLGHDTLSPRKHTDSIHNKTCNLLDSFDVDDLIEYELLRGRTIEFENYPIQEEPTKSSLQLKAEIDFSDAKKDIEELIELLKQVEVIKNRIFKEAV